MILAWFLTGWNGPWSGASVWAEGVPSDPGVNSSASLPFDVHLSDDQNRQRPLHLSEAAEKTAQADALYAQALNLGHDSDPASTIEQLQQVLNLDPQFTEAQVRVGNLLLQQGQTQTALDHLQAARKANPDSVPIKSALGYALHLQGKDEEAVPLCQEALTQDYAQSTAMRVILEVATDQGSLQKGYEQVRNILNQGGDKTPASAWLTLGRLYVELARTDRHDISIDSMLSVLLNIYQTAAAKTPPSPQAILMLADTYRNLGKTQEALQAMQQALNLDPSNVTILIHCAELEMDLNQKQEALRDDEIAYQINPSILGLRETLAGMYLDNGRYADAVRLLELINQDHPHDPSTVIDLGLAYMGHAQPKKARECFRELLTLSLTTPEPLLKLAVFQLARHDPQGAGMTLEHAQKRFPSSLFIRFYQAVQLRALQKYEAALAILKEVKLKAHRIDTEILSINFYIEMALTANLAGEDDLAEEVLHEGIAKYPNSPELLNELAYFWVDHQENLAAAEALSLKAVHLKPDMASLQDTLGWIYYRENRYQEALPYLQHAAQITQYDAVVNLHLGETYLKLGQPKRALAAWRNGLKGDPKNQELRKRIAAVKGQS